MWGPRNVSSWQNCAGVIMWNDGGIYWYLFLLNFRCVPLSTKTENILTSSSAKAYYIVLQAVYHSYSGASVSQTGQA